MRRTEAGVKSGKCGALASPPLKQPRPQSITERVTVTRRQFLLPLREKRKRMNGLRAAPQRPFGRERLRGPPLFTFGTSMPSAVARSI
jgi:hypothetical protein